ncbi:MAG: zinc ribbon domain-containing protein [Nitrospinae bacterium]|nr:zinc ribbon domain-containing protein [Nitrospinota bacterium]
MPIYEYECTKCSDNFEITQKITDKPLKKCSKCGGKLQKIISNTSFVLKGTGWYKTDYAAKPKEGSKKEEKSSEAQKKPSEKISETAAK